MKIAFLSARGVRAGGWGGGTEHFFVQALKKGGHDVSVVDYPSLTEFPPDSLSHYIKRILKHLVPVSVLDSLRLSTLGPGKSILRIGGGRRRNATWSTSRLIKYGEYFTPAVQALAPDIVVSMDNRVVAYLNTTRPIVVWGDAVFDALLNVYPRFSNLCEESIREGRDAEGRQFENATLVVYSSEWAVAAAERFHKVPAEKLACIPYGANFETEQDQEAIPAAIRARPRDFCRLLFISSEWHRKGGDYVLRLHERLKREGIACTLTILGHYPKKVTRTPDVTCIPFIDKSDEGGQRAMLDLLRQSHFLLLPTRADCTPMVIPEANSSGVPVLTSDAGGIPSLIDFGNTGFYSPLDLFEEEASAFVVDAFQNYENTYLPLAHGAYAHYRRKLNWDVAAKRFSDLVSEKLDKHANAAGLVPALCPSAQQEERQNDVKC